MAEDAPRRRSGRPPLDPTDPSVAVTVRMPTKHYDALYHAARTARCTVSDVIRRALRRHLPRDPPR